MELERLLKQPVKKKMKGKRPKGETKTRWKDQVRMEIGKRGVNCLDVEEQEM